MANILTLVFNPDPRLRLRSTEIPESDIPGYASLVEDMGASMKKYKGIGLAAPQIGQNIRLVIVSTKEGPIALFNPVIKKKSLLKAWDEEGCLSIPHVFGDVRRHVKLQCEFTDLEGQRRLIEAEGLLARVIQHEIDHIDGILFIDKAKNIREA